MVFDVVLLDGREPRSATHRRHVQCAGSRETQTRFGKGGCSSKESTSHHFREREFVECWGLFFGSRGLLLWLLCAADKVAKIIRVAALEKSGDPTSAKPGPSFSLQSRSQHQLPHFGDVRSDNGPSHCGAKFQKLVDNFHFQNFQSLRERGG